VANEEWMDPIDNCTDKACSFASKNSARFLLSNSFPYQNAKLLFIEEAPWQRQCAVEGFVLCEISLDFSSPVPWKWQVRCVRPHLQFADDASGDEASGPGSFRV
jgi:hypothetical protein